MGREGTADCRAVRERDYHQPCVHCTSHTSCNSSLISRLSLDAVGASTISIGITPNAHVCFARRDKIGRK